MATGDGEPQHGKARRELIREYLLERGAVTTSELQSRLGVSSMTVRRDLLTLERRGSLNRTHGGAVLPDPTASRPFVHRSTAGGGAATHLAAMAARLVHDGETIFLDSSPIALLVAQRIATQSVTVRVITNSVPVMLALVACDDRRLEFHAIGGAFRRPTSSFAGTSSVQMIREHYADRLFMSAAVTRNGELAEADEQEAAVKRAMLDQASESVLLVNESNLVAKGNHAIGSLDQLTLAFATGLARAEIALLRDQGLAVSAVDADVRRQRRA